MGTRRDGREINRQAMPGTVAATPPVRSCWRSCGSSVIHPPDPAFAVPRQVCISELSAVLEKTLIRKITIPFAQHPADRAAPRARPGTTCPGRAMESLDGHLGLCRNPAKELADPHPCPKWLVCRVISIVKIYFQIGLFALSIETQELIRMFNKKFSDGGSGYPKSFRNVPTCPPSDLGVVLIRPGNAHPAWGQQIRCPICRITTPTEHPASIWSVPLGAPPRRFIGKQADFSGGS